MKKISLLIQKPIEKKATSERAELISFFVERINESRKGTKYKPVTGKNIAIMLSHLSMQDLYYMMSNMKDLGGERAIKWFYWSLRDEGNE